MKSALEKIVFFECRIDQLTADLERANAEVERLRADLAEAAKRELAVRQELAGTEARAGRAERERDEALERANVARLERERLLDRLIEAERIRQAGETGEDIDLAAFISELRAEIISLRAAAASASPAHAAASAAPAPAASAPPAPLVAAHLGAAYGSAEEAARSLASEGRLGISDSDRETLRSNARFETRSEETLFSLSLRELTSTDLAARVRAAQRLKSVGARAALPAVAAALNSETSPEAQCALLEVFAAACDVSVLPLLTPKLSSPFEDVRLAALEAAYRLRAPGVLEQAIGDASARVRRRAAVLAAGDSAALPVLEKAAADADPSVRRVAVLGMGSAGKGQAGDALLSKLDDADPSVRRAAAKGLSRSFGPDVFSIADLDAARRRREIRRLASATPRGVVESASQPVAAAPAPAPVAEAASHPAPPVYADNPLEGEIVSRVYAALRGRSADELAREVGARAEVVVAVAGALERRGRLVRRGQRYFVP